MVQEFLHCCSNKPDFQITYSVSGSKKDYFVCLSCINLECFSKFILTKVPIASFKNKNKKNHLSEKYDESEEIDERQTECDENIAAPIEESEHVITFAEGLP